MCWFVQALADCVKDLLSPFQNDSVDLVAGIDAMGFILGKTLMFFNYSVRTKSCSILTVRKKPTMFGSPTKVQGER